MNEALELLAMEQDNVVSRSQLAALGMDRYSVRGQVRGRRWRTIGEQAVVLHRGPLGFRARVWAAVLECGAGAAVAAQTALRLYGLDDIGTETVQLVVARGTRIRPLPGVKVHESRRFRPERDIHPTRRPPVVRVERAAIDAAVWTRRTRSACAVLAAAVRERMTTASRLKTELRSAGQVRHRRLLAAVLNDIEGGTHALSEIDFARLCRRFGMPPPTRQAIRLDAQGRRRYLDAEFRRPDGSVFAVEVDGGVHLQPAKSWDDAIRANDIVIGGTPLLRFPSVIIRTDTAIVRRQLLAMWHGATPIAA